ncbi:MAG: alpha-glucan family phosphorylase [Nevskiales bacterium]|nr:alpha-glucan family phosphorylase [Nevskiales bacterium]
MDSQPSTFTLELQPRLPEALSRLQDLASNLMYSWDRRIRGLFWRLDADLWQRCGNNPKVFLRQVAQAKLDAAAVDPDFLYEYHGALSAFDIYSSTRPGDELRELLDPDHDLIAYFCAEYGLHESLPVYSGGLGILAGDHCKSASDLCVPLVAVGLFYHQGYFTQQIDAHGQQHALYLPVTSDDLPIRKVLDADGQELRVDAPIGDRTVHLRIWQADVGHVRLILLDCDVPENPPELQQITYQLYGGGQDMRIQQELVLGVGGVRALRAMGLQPTAWHINEGHAAFSIVERMREQIANGIDFDAAAECVASGTVFTTHTVVPAGHDRFPHDLVLHFLGPLIRELKVDPARFLALGAEPSAGVFNMTALALRGARFVNGVSQIHGLIVSEAESYIWPQIAPGENPMNAITNGIHLHTFMARLWVQLLHDHFPEWTKHLLDRSYWNAIDQIPYHRFVAVRQQLKRDLLIDVHERLCEQHRRNGTPEAVIGRITRFVQESNTNAVVVGFARRFATYKRATLILRDRERIARLLNDPQRPMLMIFAGKAHPRDEPGQALIRELYAASMEDDLIGRLIVVEGYDLHFSRNLVQGCDVWLNTPEYPMEACGTSGMKAGINGVVNVSVLDGWWPEGYTGDNGFAVKPVGSHFDPAARAAQEGKQLMDILESQVIPKYFGPENVGWSEAWVRLAKNSMKTIIPHFNGERMMQDYLRTAYGPAIARARALSQDGHCGAIELATWKRKLEQAWGGVKLQLAEPPPSSLYSDQRLRLRIDAQLNGLAPEDLAIECVLGRKIPFDGFEPLLALRFNPGTLLDGHASYELELDPLPGLQHIRIRAYPHHPMMTHPFETGHMVWL